MDRETGRFRDDLLEVADLVQEGNDLLEGLLVLRRLLPGGEARVGGREQRIARFSAFSAFSAGFASASDSRTSIISIRNDGSIFARSRSFAPAFSP